MKVSNKQIGAALAVGTALVALFGFVAPYLVSAPSDGMVGLGFLLIMLVAIAGVAVVRNVLGMNPADNDEEE